MEVVDEVSGTVGFWGSVVPVWRIGDVVVELDVVGGVVETVGFWEVVVPERESVVDVVEMVGAVVEMEVVGVVGDGVGDFLVVAKHNFAKMPRFSAPEVTGDFEAFASPGFGAEVEAEGRRAQLFKSASY